MKMPKHRNNTVKYILMITCLVFVIIMFIMMYNLAKNAPVDKPEYENAYPIELID